MEIKTKFINAVKSIDINTLGGYTYEQVMNNKNCSKDPKYWYLIKNTKNNEDPKFLFRSEIAESWEFFYPEVENPVRNTNQIYLKFLNSLAFQSEANKFKEKGYYAESMEGTKLYDDYWDEQERYITNGKIIDGVRITGRHYFAVNFGRIKARPTDIYGNYTSTRKMETFLQLIDHQYYLLNELEEVIKEGIYANKEDFLEWFPLQTEIDFLTLKKQNFLSVKSRRKGFSYIVDNALYAYTWTFVPNSISKLFAYGKAAYETTLAGMHMTLNFLNEYTDFGKRRDVLNKREHFRSSFKEINDFGMEVEKGYKSEFQAVSFSDSSFKSIGSSADIIGVEEAGVFNNLLETFAVSIEPLIRDGEFYIGNSILWGSAGDMEAGGSISLKEMVYRPSAYNIKEYNNIYEETFRNEKVGWFIDDLWYSPNVLQKKTLLENVKDENLKAFIERNYGDIIFAVDNQGNSHRWLVKPMLEVKRKASKKGSVRSYEKLITQQPMYLSEAFLINEGSPFDTMSSQQALATLKTSDKIYKETGTFGIGEKDTIIWHPNPSLIAIEEFPTKMDNTDGCWLIYNFPEEGTTIDWRYISGLDPIDFGYEESSKGNQHSLAAGYIIDTLTRNIVAEYVGRPATAEEYYEQFWRGLEFYNAQVLYENNLKGFFSYLRGKNKLYLLADEPESLKDRRGYNSGGRAKGFHATAPINNYARELINKWSLENIVINQDEEGNTETQIRMYFIPSIALLQEMVNWNSKGNFDRISGLGAAMILLFDRQHLFEESNKKTTNFFNSSIFKKVKRKFN